MRLGTRTIGWGLGVVVAAAVVVESMALAAGKTMPQFPITGGRKAGYAFKPEYEKMVKELGVVYTMPEARKATWEEATKWFDFSKTLPTPTANELTYEEGFLSKHTVKTEHLTAIFAKLQKMTFSDPKYGLKSPAVPEEAWLKSTGNILAHFKDLRGKAAETDRDLATLQTKYPAIWADAGQYLAPVVRASYLYSTKWDPYVPESTPGKDDDGVLFLPYWKMQPNPSRGKYWNDNPNEHHVYQAGVFMYATLEQVKTTERNFAEYMDYVGMGNLEVAPISGSYFRGVDKKGDEFMGIEVFNSGQLPFPYNMASFVMKMFDHYNADGIYVCEYYSTNRNDLNYMAGRDTFFDIRDTDGNYVGQLIATELDYDIKGLPERDKDRIVTIRGNWGNIKLIVEGYKGLSKVSTGPGAWKK